ncbi:MAG: hypothetical protein IJV41_05060 [Oscillospiraceae bacterium]|nr:hypothetical protein [Oscillospiraceae bacterium]
MTHVFTGVLWLALCLVISYFAAREFYKIAEDKGYHGRKYFWWAFLLPLVGYLLIVAMPDRGTNQRTVVNEDLPEL